MGGASSSAAEHEGYRAYHQDHDMDGHPGRSYPHGLIFWACVVVMVDYLESPSNLYRVTQPSFAESAAEQQEMPLSVAAESPQLLPVEEAKADVDSAKAAVGTGESAARIKRDELWSKVLAEGPGASSYPDVKALTAYGKGFDYTSLLDYTPDVQPEGRQKVVCSAGGAVAPVRFEWRQQAREHFSGLFRAADYGLIRCSSVIEPSAPSSWSPLPAMIPMVGLKFFREGDAPSGNIVLAHKKSGGKEANFMKYSLSNHFTENVKYPFKAALALFQKYSRFPTFTGLTDFACMTQEGKREEKVVSPYALVLIPTESLQAKEASFAGGLSEQLGSIPAGEILYEVYAVPEPLSAGMDEKKARPCTSVSVEMCPNIPAIWRIGELRLVAPFVSSSFGDSTLFFRHNLVDKDLEYRPDWTPKIDTLLGAPFYHSIIQSGDIWDPEAPPKKETPHPTRPPSIMERAASFKEQEQKEEEELARALSNDPVLSAALGSMTCPVTGQTAPPGTAPPRRGCCPFAGCFRPTAR